MPVPFSPFLQNIFRRLKSAFARAKPPDVETLVVGTIKTFAAEDLPRDDFGTMPADNQSPIGDTKWFAQNLANGRMKP